MFIHLQHITVSKVLLLLREKKKLKRYNPSQQAWITENIFKTQRILVQLNGDIPKNDP